MTLTGLLPISDVPFGYGDGALRESSVIPLCLGKNWYPLEYYAGHEFRWIRNDAEIIVTSPLSQPFTLVLEIEPVHQSNQMLQLLAGDGSVLAETELPPTRGYVHFRITQRSPHDRLILHLNSVLRAGSDRDPRDLSFRVFRMGWRSKSLTEFYFESLTRALVEVPTMGGLHRLPAVRTVVKVVSRLRRFHAGFNAAALFYREMLTRLDDYSQEDHGTGPGGS